MVPEEQNACRAQRRPAVVISLTHLSEMMDVLNHVKINGF